MTKNHPDEMQADLRKAEWKIRTELAAAYRLVALFGWDDLVFTHLSARVPGPDHHFLINPYGLNYDEVTASNLVKIDINGHVVEHSDHPINEAGFIIHSAIHMLENTSNHVIMHTHSRAGMAVAALKDGLLPISMGATMFYDDIAYHDYEGPSLYLDERSRLQASLGNKKALILRNHGLMTVGETVPEAFVRLYRLESACRTQLDASAAGEVNLLDHDTASKSGQDVNRFMESADDYGQLEFNALMRKIDKLDDSYRQ